MGRAGASAPWGLTLPVWVGESLKIGHHTEDAVDADSSGEYVRDGG